jgi:hypothetical protein
MRRAWEWRQFWGRCRVDHHGAKNRSAKRMENGVFAATHSPPWRRDPMYGPAVRRKRFCRSGGCAVLHQCIRPLVGACVLRATMDISARAISLADRPRPGHSGHQCSHAPGRPILHLVSSSRRPRRETGGGTTSLRAPCLCSSFVRAVRPFLRPGLCLFPGTAHRGRQGWPSRLGLPLAPGFQAMP